MNCELRIVNKEQNLREAEVIKNLSKSWKKGMWKSVLKGMLITLVVIVILAIIIFIFADIRAFPSY